MNTDIATLVLRLLFGGLFIYYGYMKLDMYSQYAGMFPDYLGLGAKPTYILVSCCELIGGILLVLGLFTRLAIIPIFIIMVVVYFVTHKKDVFTAKQLEFFYMFICILVFILGGGRYSLDALLFGNRNRAANAGS